MNQIVHFYNCVSPNIARHNIIYMYKHYTNYKYVYFFYIITTTGTPSAPEILSASISWCDENSCMVTVEWSEPFISCAGSVSQYVLTVTPPTPDCGSEDCVTDQTQYSLTLTVDVMYDFTVRADTCRNTRRGDDSDTVSVLIHGRLHALTMGN